MPPASNADHKRLYKLFAMLPGPENGHFWERVAEANSMPVDYIYRKMATAADFVDEPVSKSEFYDVTYFCKYVIMFFGGDKPRLWRALAAHVANLGDNEGDLGGRFAKDLADTAWRVIVAYTSVDPNRRAEAWRGARPPKQQ